jgi:hypothetical protein
LETDPYLFLNIWFDPVMPKPFDAPYYYPYALAPPLMKVVYMFWASENDDTANPSLPAA